MREKNQVQAVLDLPSPSSSTVTAQSEGKGTPVKKVDPTSTASSAKKKGKKVNFSSPPKWRIKHVVGKGSSRSERTALKALPTNTKRLVGRGSPRIPTVGKGQSSKLKQTVITCTSPLSIQKLSRHTEKALSEDPTPQTADQGSQTDSDVTFSLDYRMCTEEEPPSEYWRSLAEQRRVALAETLQENEELYTEVGSLRKQVTELEGKVKDLEYFAMMYKLASNNDS